MDFFQTYSEVISNRQEILDRELTYYFPLETDLVRNSVRRKFCPLTGQIRASRSIADKYVCLSMPPYEMWRWQHNLMDISV